MQRFGWYIRRLRGMSGGEIAWRIRSRLRDVVDRGRLALGLCPVLSSGMSTTGEGEGGPGFRVTDVLPGEWSARAHGDTEGAWCEGLLGRAARIAAGRLTFFDLEDRFLGEPIDWNREHDCGKASPMRFAPSIDYRDYRVTGDAKIVWEPNRHHHLVVLGRAYRASGDVRYASAVTRQIESWMSQCPFGIGMNWRSPLELAIRLINWVWAVDLIRESGLAGGEFLARLRHAAFLHLWEITRKYSCGSSANNHLIGEAAGVFIGANYFGDLPDSSRWVEESRGILCREIEAQTYGDGCGREHALGYHLFILQLFLLAGLTARMKGADFPPAYWARLERMIEFAGALAEGGFPPMFGDSDDGHVLDLGIGPCDIFDLISMGAVLFKRSDFKSWAGRYSEAARWMLSREGRSRFDSIAPADGSERLGPVAFPESGYYLLQGGRRGANDRISVFFDCAELGFKSIAAHGHADALSFTLRAFGEDVFVDPGTYDYFKFPEWRDYFRSTRAHNTVVIDDADQSEMLGPFLWGARARARCIRWEPRPEGGTVTGEHDGYLRLGDTVVHRRTLDLDGKSRTLTIRDEIDAGGRHEVKIFFHLSERSELSRMNSHSWKIAVGEGEVRLDMDDRFSVEVLKGSESPIGGWVSRGYHRKVASPTICGRVLISGKDAFTCRVEIAPPEPSAGDRGPNYVSDMPISFL